MEGSYSFTFQARQGGRYDVFESFASGGIATVHLARYCSPSGLAKVVAVKKLHGQFAQDAEFRGALLDEARLVARIHHTNVVEMLDVCDEGGNLFLAMEYVHGVSLARLMKAREGAPLDPVIACNVAVSALKGLHAAHEAKGTDGALLGLVHRDISPQNLIVGVNGVTRVIDFGLAYAMGRSNMTKSGVVKGKPSYMAPEQMRGERVTRTADVFSMGVTLWGMLTGKKLFDADVVEAQIFQLLAGEIRHPRELVPSIPEALDAAVMKALERTPTERFPTALAFAKAIEAAVPPPEPGAVADWVESAGVVYLAEMNERLQVAEHDDSPHPADHDGPTIKRQSPSQPEILRVDSGEVDVSFSTISKPAVVVAMQPAVEKTPSALMAAQPAPARRNGMATLAILASVGALLVIGGVTVAALSARTPSPSTPSSTSASAMAASTTPPPAAASVASAEPSVSAAPQAPVDFELIGGATPDPTPSASAAKPAPTATAKKPPKCNDPLNPKCN